MKNEKIEKRKIAQPITLFLILSLLLTCLLFVIFTLNFMSGTTELSRNLTQIVNAQLPAFGLKKSQGVSASIELTPGCSIWALEFVTAECGAIEVPEELVNSGFISQITLISLKPCGFLKNLTIDERGEMLKYFNCGTKMQHYKITVDILRITEFHPEQGITINKKEKIGTILIKNF